MTARIQVPAQVRRGETVEIRIIIQHPMETGYRRDEIGQLVPRNVIRRLSCRYGGEEVFSAEFSSGIAANPYLVFTTLAVASADLEFSWVDDAGQAGSARHSLTVLG
jgi:sulfur-oxidizing protein SoxZ